jgi:hypothetical protein
MVDRVYPGEHRPTPHETRRSEPQDTGEHFIPLYLSDRDGEPDPSEYVAPAAGRRVSISARILAAVCAAAAVAVLFALFSSDAMRDFINVKASMAGMASLLPAPSVAAPSNPSSPAIPAWKDPTKDPARLSAPANSAPRAATITMAAVAPSREDVKNAYQSALQGQTPAQNPPPVAAVAEPPAAPAPALHRIDPREIDAALKRAYGLIGSGDIAAARLVLERPARDGDPQAALMLARTYDAEILDKLAVHGIVPDFAMARHWYEAAKNFGSAEASQRLDVLASENH